MSTSPNTLANRFEDVFRRLLARESLDLYERDLSMMFESISTNLLGKLSARRGCYFDGVVGMISTVRSTRKVEFVGEMWVGRDGNQWTEPFYATVVDKRSTKQGIWITISVGDDKMEADLSFAFGCQA